MNKKWILVLILIVPIITLFFLNSSKGKSRTKNYDPGQGENSSKERPSIFESLKQKVSKPKNTCLMSEEYVEVDDPNAPILSIPFDKNDYSNKHWGIVPFCAMIGTGRIHSAIDFELKANSKVYSSTDGVVDHTQIGKEEGSGEIVAIQGVNFNIGYSGLTNLQVKAGDKVERGDYIGNAVLIPHGEYHVHLGLTYKETDQCPLKYMDEEFLEAFKEMFSKADYGSQTDAPCACNCETYTQNY